jgi:hypothetical protein
VAVEHLADDGVSGNRGKVFYFVERAIIQSLFRVPAVYLTWANPVFLAFFSFNGISNLHGINEAQNSDSPRLHHLYVSQVAGDWFGRAY